MVKLQIVDKKLLLNIGADTTKHWNNSYSRNSFLIISKADTVNKKKFLNYYRTVCDQKTFQT